MAVWSPLTTHFAVNTIDSSPRTSQVDSIGHHHTATNNKAVALSLFAPGGRTVTPNYFISGKEIWGIVPEDRRAWTSGSEVDDSRSITYEILNSTNGPDWGFSSDSLDTVVRLDAEISKRYGIRLQHSVPGIWEHKNLYQWFGRSYATACAGPSFNISEIIRRVSDYSQPKPKITRNRSNTMIGLYGADGEGRYGKKGVTYWWVFDPDNRVITYLDAAGAKALSTTMGTSFGNAPYKTWDAFHMQADTFIDATVDPPVRLSGPVGAK